MKKLLLYCVAIALSTVVSAQQYVMTSQGYTVNGQVIKGEGYVTLRTYLADGNELLDSVVMDKKGKFIFRGLTEQPVPALLTVNGKKSYRLYLEPKMQMELEINMKKSIFKTKNAPMTDQWYSIVNPQNKEDRYVYLARLENWAMNNEKHIFSPDIMASYLSYQWDSEEIDKHLNVLKGDAAKCYYYFHLRKRQEQLGSLAKGKTVPDVSLRSADNKTVSLNTFIKQKKYVLVYFFASWCDECREEIPSLQAVYGKYKAKGFDIYSVSLDNNLKDWKQMLKEDGIKWTSVCDTKKWDGETVKQYQIKSLPSNILIDNNGKIIARNINTDELSAQLAELLDYQGFTVAGNIKGITEGTAVLELLLENGNKQKFTSRIINGDFKFASSVDKVCMGMLTLPVKDGVISFFMGNDNITVSGEKGKLENAVIKGSHSQDEFAAIAASCNRKNNPMQCLMNYVSDNPSSIYSPFIISNYLYPYLNEEDRNAAVNSLRGDATSMFQYHLLKNQQDEDNSKKDLVSDKAKDFTLKNIKNEDVNLYYQIMFTDYTLVSFWASWDNASRNRNLDYLRLYNNYRKNNNFDIISVSLDDSKVQWENAVKQDGIGKWQNVSDLKRWSSSVVRLYDLKSIPSNMLLDKNGNILGKNLSLDEIIRIITNK